MTNSARDSAISKALVYPIPNPCYTNQNLRVVLCQIATDTLCNSVPFPKAHFPGFHPAKVHKIPVHPIRQIPRPKQNRNTVTLVPNSQPHENGSNQKSRLIIFFVLSSRSFEFLDAKTFCIPIFPYLPSSAHSDILCNASPCKFMCQCANVTL
jgi:hypothetical protein